MYFRTFYLIIFIITNFIFALSMYKPTYILNLCQSICKEESLPIQQIQLTSIIATLISLILLIISHYYTQKRLAEEQKKIKLDRLNIEQIHQELEALKN